MAARGCPNEPCARRHTPISRGTAASRRKWRPRRRAERGALGAGRHREGKAAQATVGDDAREEGGDAHIVAANVEVGEARASLQRYRHRLDCLLRPHRQIVVLRFAYASMPFDPMMSFKCSAEFCRGTTDLD